MSIYTRTGDEGKTSIIGGRVIKDDLRIEAYGTIDELNSYVGQAVSLSESEKYTDLKEQLIRIQHELFDCGSDLAYASPSEAGFKVSADMSKELESWIDSYEEENPKLERFILPGGTLLSSSLHICRTVCRRAERRTVTLSNALDINPAVLQYLNRLSDYFFSAARAANVRENMPDIEYIRSAKVFRS